MARIANRPADGSATPLTGSSQPRPLASRKYITGVLAEGRVTLISVHLGIIPRRSRDLWAAAGCTNTELISASAPLVMSNWYRPEAGVKDTRDANDLFAAVCVFCSA